MGVTISGISVGSAAAISGAVGAIVGAFVMMACVGARVGAFAISAAVGFAVGAVVGAFAISAVVGVGVALGETPGDGSPVGSSAPKSVNSIVFL